MKIKKEKLVVFDDKHKGEFNTSFLGKYSSVLQFEGFKLSIVNYTEAVSEEWHFHEKKHISSIISGGNLESRKSRDIQVLPGKIMIYEEGEMHRNRFTAHPSVNLNIEFEDHFFNNNTEFSKIRLNPDIVTEFYRIYFELISDNALSDGIEFQVKSLFSDPYTDNEGRWMEQLKDLLNDRWSEFISLEELSKQLNVHPVTISKSFTKNNHITLSEYMRRLKTKRALDYILNSNLSFVQIAYVCGFSDQSHMIRLVKKHTGLTPLQIKTLK